MRRRLTSALTSCLVLTAAAVMGPAAWSSQPHLAPGVHPVLVPAQARAVSTAHPTTVIGTGTPASCTSAAVVAAVHSGGVIRFSCGPKPVTIKMHQTAKVVNTSKRVVLDGRGLVTLSGMGHRRILYMDTCDPVQIWTTSHCQDQDYPQLVVQNLSFTGGNSSGQDFDGGGGGAIFARGGRLKIVNSHFMANRCDHNGPDVGGAAVRALSEYHTLPVYVVHSSFSGGRCSNGGALSSIGVSWTVLNSSFLANRADGFGANPAAPGTKGGGSGGAIYSDGDTIKLKIAGSVFKSNYANEGGGSILFVSDDRTGTMSINRSSLIHNPNYSFHTAGLPGIFFLGAHKPAITDSILH